MQVQLYQGQQELCFSLLLQIVLLDLLRFLTFRLRKPRRILLQISTQFSLQTCTPLPEAEALSL